MSDLYDRDFYAWANEQVALLRSGNLPSADIANIAEEIESMGRSEKRELVNRLNVLLKHLLKWKYQPERRGTSWRLSIANSRDQLTDHLNENPSLKAHRLDAMASAYRYARRETAIETGLPASTFPVSCPWTFDQTMSGEPSETERVAALKASGTPPG